MSRGSADLLSISWAVVTHPDRLVQAEALAQQLNAPMTVDDGRGAAANHLHAWELAAATPADFTAVIEDDAEPIPDFTSQAEAALRTAPSPIVSFYLGRGKPPHWQQPIAQALRDADTHGAHWVTSRTVLHAVAVTLRTDLIPDWLEWAHASTLPADQRLTAWAQHHNHPVAYTIPSLVDHRDQPSLITPSTVPRRAWQTGGRRTWTSRTVQGSGVLD